MSGFTSAALEQILKMFVLPKVWATISAGSHNCIDCKKDLTALGIRIVVVVYIQLLPHWTVAFNLEGNKKIKFTFLFHNLFKAQPTWLDLTWTVVEKCRGQRAHKHQCPLWYLGLQSNKSWIPQLWASLFHIHRPKAKVAACAPFHCPAQSMANRLYQWKQHQFVQDDTFS